MTQPNDNQVQIIVFGTGNGESILIHLGNQEWVIVDSCKEGNNENPVAIEYLDDIGVDAKKVKLVIVTHWDQDHVRGMSKIIEKCVSAKFVLPSVFCFREFIAYLEESKKQTVSIQKSISNEFIPCMEILKSKKIEKIFASENKIIWEKEASQYEHRRDVQILALSPSDRLLGEFLKKIPKIKNFGKKQISSEDRNKTSVAVLVTVGKFSILLGADVPSYKKNKKGWRRIIHILENRSLKSKIYKVAHHGSDKSDCNEIWTELVNKPYSIVTPFSRSGLPTVQDIQRIRSCPGIAYITCSKINQIQSNRFNKNLSGSQQKAQKKIPAKKLAYKSGSVSITIDINQNYKINDPVLKDGAMQL